MFDRRNPRPEISSDYGCVICWQMGERDASIGEWLVRSRGQRVRVEAPLGARILIQKVGAGHSAAGLVT